MHYTLTPIVTQFQEALNKWICIHFSFVIEPICRTFFSIIYLLTLNLSLKLFCLRVSSIPIMLLPEDLYP